MPAIQPLNMLSATDAVSQATVTSFNSSSSTFPLFPYLAVSVETGVSLSYALPQWRDEKSYHNSDKLKWEEEGAEEEGARLGGRGGDQHTYTHGPVWRLIWSTVLWTVASEETGGSDGRASPNFTNLLIYLLTYLFIHPGLVLCCVSDEDERNDEESVHLWGHPTTGVWGELVGYSQVWQTFDFV